MITAAAARAPAPESKTAAVPKTTLAARVLFAVIILLGASAFPELRVRLFGMMIHPVTLGCAALFTVAALRIRQMPAVITAALLVFLTAFGISCLAGPSGGLAYFAKTAASVVTIFVCALFIRNESDFRWTTFAFCIALCIMSARGIANFGEAGVRGVNPLLGVSNKNGFSVFALPALLLAGFVALRVTTPRWQRFALGGMCLFIVFVVFGTGNRSGWGGVVLVAFMLALPALRRLGAALMLVSLVATGAVLVVEYGNKEVIQDRVGKTNSKSGERRLQFIQSAAQVGLNQPLLGSSPQGLPAAMARLSTIRGGEYDSHNVSVLIFGGTGMLGVLTLGFLTWTLAQRPRLRRGALDIEKREAHYLLRALLILWFLRGQFTAEVLYSPSFSIAIGLCIGLCTMSGVWRREVSPRPLRRGGPSASLARTVPLRPSP